MLNLATFMTACTHGAHSPRAPIAVGKHEAVTHMMHNVLTSDPCTGPCNLEVGCLRYVPESAGAAAAELVQLVGLDEKMVTPTQMEKAETRFLCESCY